MNNELSNKLNRLRVTGKNHSVYYTNSEHTIRMVASYNGIKPLRAMIENDIDGYESGILIDYIQLEIKNKDLKLTSIRSI